MTYLVDADVLSEATEPDPDPGVLEWLSRHERDVAVDPVVLGEIRFGILILPIGKRRRSLERWFEAGVEQIHCLPWEAGTGLRWAQLLADLRTNGRSMQIKDSMIERPSGLRSPGGQVGACPATVRSSLSPRHLLTSTRRRGVEGVAAPD